MIICADDFGLSPGISQAILKLAEAKLVTATSAIVCFKDSVEDCRQLKSHANNLDIGLHLYFTHPFKSRPLLTRNMFSMDLFTKRAQENLKQQILTQLIEFKQRFEFVPHFIDGHLHLHSFPLIKNILAQVLKENPTFSPNYVRGYQWTSSSWTAFALSALWHMPNRKWQELEVKESEKILILPVNTVESIPSTLKKVLTHLQSSNDLLCLHPGLVDETLRLRDPIHEHRELCYQFMLSKDYLDLIKSFGGMNRYE